MNIYAKSLLSILIVFSLFVIDQYTKFMAIHYLKDQESISFLNDFFTFAYSENTGAMLSLGSDLPEHIRFILFTAMTGLALFAGFWYLLTTPISKHQFVFVLFILAGGLGNLYDRAFDGYVVDFMLLQIGTLRTGVFNIADVLIMIGCVGFLFSSDNSVRAEAAA